MDTRFEVLGAERVIPLKRCDIDYEEDAHRWLNHIFEVVQNKEAGTSQATPAKASSGRKNTEEKYLLLLTLMILLLIKRPITSRLKQKNQLHTAREMH